MTSTKSTGEMSMVYPPAESIADVSVDDRTEREDVAWAYPPRIRNNRNIAISLIRIFIVIDAMLLVN